MLTNKEESLTLTGLPPAGENSKLHHYRQKKLKDLTKTWVSPNNRLKISDLKESKTSLLAWRTKRRNHKTPKATTEYVPFNQQETNWRKNWRKAFRLKPLELELKIKSLHVQLLCSLDGTRHGQWHKQGYHVQAQIQSPVITNKKYKK